MTAARWTAVAVAVWGSSAAWSPVPLEVVVVVAAVVGAALVSPWALRWTAGGAS